MLNYVLNGLGRSFMAAVGHNLNFLCCDSLADPEKRETRGTLHSIAPPPTHAPGLTRLSGPKKQEVNSCSPNKKSCL